MNSVALLAAAETEQDLPVSLVRMCVAEARYDPERARTPDAPAPVRFCVGFTLARMGLVQPERLGVQHVE